MDELLQIGRFARLAGLSVGSLRHYDEVDLLRPARTDRRAHLAAGATAEAEVASWKARATAVLDGLTDPDDREILAGDLATLP